MYLPSSREPRPRTNTPTHTYVSTSAHIQTTHADRSGALVFVYVVGRTFVMINSARQQGYLLIKLLDIMCKSALLAGELILNCKLS